MLNATTKTAIEIKEIVETAILIVEIKILETINAIANAITKPAILTA